MLNETASGLRRLRRHPAFSAAIVTTLAIAIGANAAVFSVIDRLMLRPLPFPGPERLMYVENSWPLFQNSVNGEPASSPEDAFSHMARYELGRASIGGGMSPRVIKVARVTGSYFPILAVNPAAGRLFSTTDESVVVINHALWRSLFNADPAVAGRTLTLNGRAFTVSGVMPADFAFYVRGEPAEAWIPFMEDDALISLAQVEGSGTIARLKSGVSLPQAHALTGVRFQRLAQSRPELRLADDDRPRFVPLRDQWFGALRPPLLLLLGAAGCLLLIACANTTGLMLARAAANQKDTAIRAALGAGRDRLMRQSLAESLLLGLIATSAGLLLAVWGAKALLAISPTRVPLAGEIGVSVRMVAFALIIALPAASISGLVAAWRVSRADLSRALSAGLRTGVFVSLRTRRFLVATQVAVTAMLLINAGLLIRSFRALRGEATGFDAQNVLTMEIAPAEGRFPDRPSRLAYYQRIVGAVRDLSGVSGVGMVNYLPLYSGSFIVPVTLPERPETAESALSWSYRIASPGYFGAMGIPLLAGREFTEGDQLDAPLVAVVDRSAASMLVTVGASVDGVIGRRISLRGETFEIVGVAGDVRQQGLGIAAYPGFYLSAFQRPPTVANLVVRTTAHPAGLADPVSRALAAADADLPVGSLRLMEAQVTETVSRRRFAVFLSGVLGASALVLSIVGLYALMSQLVAHRAHEIGVRVALGARPGNVVELVLRQGIGVVTIGLVAGLAAAYGTTRLLAGLLYGVGTTDPITFAVVPLMLVAVAAMACVVPARRALRADPVAVLRGE